MERAGAVVLLEGGIEKWHNCNLGGVVERLKGVVGRSVGLKVDELRGWMAEFGDAFVEMRSALERVPDVGKLMEDVEGALNADAKKLELLEAMRNEIDALKYGDETVDKLKKQIDDVKRFRDARIKEVQRRMEGQMEERRNEAVREIEEFVAQSEGKKREMEAILENMRREIEEARDALEGIERKEQEDMGRFVEENGRIEEALARVREKLGALEAVNLAEQLAKLERSVSNLESECERRKAMLEALADAEQSGDVDAEERHLVERIRELEGDLAAAPSLEQWRSIQAEISTQKYLECSALQLSENVSRAKSQHQSLTREISRMAEQARETEMLVLSMESDVKRLNEQLVQLQGASNETVVVEVLKEERQMTQETAAARETEIENLRREQMALEARIQSLRKEKESLIDMSQPKESVKVMRPSSVTPPERILLNLVASIQSNSTVRAVFFVYVILLHILLLLVLII